MVVRISCPKCWDAGISLTSYADGLWISGYCDCLAGQLLAEKEICFECGEKKEDCICNNQSGTNLEHNTNGETCWCNPKIEIMANGNKVIIHNREN